MRKKFTYTSVNAKSYQELGINGTTYEIHFLAVERMLGGITGKIFLDFGSNAGKSAKFLKGFGASKIIGVDHNESIEDHYWTEDDYRQALSSTSFVIEDITYPKPELGDWLDETKVAPGMVIKARKKI